MTFKAGEDGDYDEMADGCGDSEDGQSSATSHAYGGGYPNGRGGSEASHNVLANENDAADKSDARNDLRSDTGEPIFRNEYNECGGKAYQRVGTEPRTFSGVSRVPDRLGRTTRTPRPSSIS
jgi:hypothetical protein